MRSVYQNHWRRWSQWCLGAGVDPLSPTAIEFANHLAFLKSSKCLSVATLRVRRSAIESTLARLQGPDFSPDRLVAGVLKGAARAEAWQPSRLSLWDLSVVLEFLRQDSFELLSYTSLESLTL
jgi:hypothetical protein